MKKMNTPPKKFNDTVYQASLSIVRQHRSSFGELAEKNIATLCGGEDLGQAVDPKDVPPCADDLDCSICWTEKYCMHKDKPKSQRRDEIVDYLQRKEEIEAADKATEPEETSSDEPEQLGELDVDKLDLGDVI